ncbi:MAG TPA: ParB/RepB/Spo0J family partition protein [Gemmataceae bacterium]|nr:ParB/RepB/Spo0J family partition protein [Gemmataceae bacterium]
MDKKTRLGRGLDALLGTTADGGDGAAAGEPKQVAVSAIERNPYQPRKAFDADELSALGESIRVHGILQPLVVRAVGDRYQLVAGERRLRAAQSVGLDSVPVRVVDFNDQQVLEAALVENIHRADLNPIEKAQGFREYLQRFHMTQEQLAARLGLARTTVTNLLGLLEMPAEVQEMVRTGQLSFAHAKLLKGVADRDRQIALARDIVARGLSVHGTEVYLRQATQEPPAEADRCEPTDDTPAKTRHLQGIEDELRQRLATRVEIRLRGKDRGQIILGFESNDDFERLLEVLRK